MRTWLLAQRLSIKLLMPSIAGVLLLVLSGFFVFVLSHQQRILQTGFDEASREERRVTDLINGYSQAQAQVYKGVSVDLAGLGTKRADEALGNTMAARKGLDSVLEQLTKDNRDTEVADSIEVVKKVSASFFEFAGQLRDNLDDPTMAAANMMTTERKYDALHNTLLWMAEKQHARMVDGSKKIDRHLSLLVTGNIVATILVAFLSIGVALVNLRIIMGFIRQAMEDVRIIASGDLNHKVAIGTGDELGELASSVDELRSSFRTIIEGVKSTVIELNSSAEGISGISGRLASDVGTVDLRTRQISSSSREVLVHARQMVNQAESVSLSTTSAAKSLDQMMTTVIEISRNCAQEASMAQTTTLSARDLEQCMLSLDAAAQEIGTILEDIDNIAAKTKLLALNATIEAVRAGQAGKGFGVVAMEVKGLAGQSGLAATRIQERVTSVQNQTRKANLSVAEITKSIGRFADISGVISAAVEEQSAMVREVAGSVTSVSGATGELVSGLRDVAERSGGVLGALEDVGGASNNAAALASEANLNAASLTRLAVDLQKSVAGFRI